MKIVSISYYVPWPLTHGGSEAQFFFLKELSQFHEITLIAPFFDAAVSRNLEELGRQLPRVNIQGVACQPIGTLSRIEARIHSVLRGLQNAYGSLKHKFSVGGKSSVNRPLNVSTPIKTLHPDFVREIRRIDWARYELVVVDFVETLSAVLAVPEHLPRIFINHQVQFVVDDRIRATSFQNENAEYLSKWNRLLEARLMSAYDAVIVFSETDRAAMMQEYGLGQVFVSRFPVPLQEVPTNPRVPPDGRTLSFLGGEAHTANRDGLQWFLKAVWPGILAAHPEAKLRVIGAWSNSFRTRFAHFGTVEFTGYVADLRTVLDGTVMVVPIRVGSGIRVKILMGISFGIPVVSTSIGCEGIPFENHVSARVADAAEEFVAAAVDLLKNPERARKLAEAALDSVAPEFSQETALSRRSEVFQAVVRAKGASTA